jgi:TDG/mug DNA glycosylase family protein
MQARYVVGQYGVIVFADVAADYDQRPGRLSPNLALPANRVAKALRQEIGEVSLIGYDPDILARGLDVVFCGINPALSAAIAGHNFSNPSNRFWPALHLAGFTGLRLQPQDERRLLEYRCGITAVVARPTSRAQDISPEEFREARLSFEAKMRHYAPRAIAFLGKRAFSIMIDQPGPAWGRQPAKFAEAMAWILPNPSGRNRSFTLDALVSAYAELHMALARPGSTRSSAATEGIRGRRLKRGMAGPFDA